MGTPPGDRLIVRLNRPALERLIGNDTEIEVQLRHQVVDEFAKRHLKSIAADPAFAAVIEAHRKVIDAELRNLVGEYVWKDGKTVAALRERITKLINEGSESAILETVRQSFEKVIEERSRELGDYLRRTENKLIENMKQAFLKTQDEFNKSLAGRVDQFFEERVQAETKRRLEAAANIHSQAVTAGNPGG